MAHATLRTDACDDDAPSATWSTHQLLAEIQRLFHELQALPGSDRPDGVPRRPRASLAYLALEARIRGYTDRYRAITDQEAAC
jgi:hypothetical protein